MYSCYRSEVCKRIVHFPLFEDDNNIGKNIAEILENTNIICEKSEDLDNE